MALQSINTIQDPESYRIFVKKYLEDTLQALANSGSRFGVSGASIKYHSYNIFDIIDDFHIDSENKSNYAIGFEYSGSQYRYQIYDLRTGSSVYGSEIKYVSENNTIDLIDEANEDSIYSSIKNKILMFFGHIQDISKNSIIHKKDNILTCIFKCHILNTDPTAEYSAEYLYFQYDTNTNKLINFLDIKPHNERYCVLYKLEHVENDNYKFDIHLFNIDSLENFIKDNFIENVNINLQLKELFRFSSDTYNEVEDSFSFLNANFTDFNVLCNIEYIYNASSIVQFILNHNSSTYSNYDIIHSVEELVTYNGEAESLYFDIDENSLISKQFLNRVSLDDIREFEWMASSINELYKYLLDIYNSNYYVSSKKQLFINIIKALYSYIYQNYANNSSAILYIPYNVKLNFLSSDINELKIMYMNNIDVIHWNGTDIELSKDHITYYDSNIENKITNYNIYIDYNNEFQDVINDIIVYKTYTYPYINKLNEWIINDVNSGISSYNELLSLNKLIILYCNKFDVDTDNENNYASYVLRLNNISDQDKKYFGEYVRTYFTVNSDYFPSYKNNIIQCNTLIPKVTELNKNFFENTILFIVTNKNNLINDNNAKYSTNYEGSYIYSLWKYTEENDEYSFKPIIDPESLEDINEKQYVFDPFGNKLSSSYSGNNISYVQANNNKTAQNVNNLTGYDYVVFRNKLGEDYANTYENNLNIIIECVNNLNKSGANPNYPDENGKFIKDTASIITSNTLYPQYQFEETNQSTITKYSKEVSSVEELINNETVQLYAYYNDSSENPILVSQQYIEEVLQTHDVVKYIPHDETISTIVVGKSNTEKYNEFIPDKQDVPTIDSKEVLHRNVNVLNRINIFGLGYNSTQFTSDTENRWYNGFFGTYFDNTISKSVLGISTNSTNINVGTDTLFNLEQVKRFNTFDVFRIDGFNSIELKPTKALVSTKPVVNQETFASNFVVKSVSCIPVGKLYAPNEDSITINLNYDNTNSSYTVQNVEELIKFATSDSNNFNVFDPINPVSEPVNKNLFIKGGTYKITIGQTGNEKLKSFNCLYLNNLIAEKFGIDKRIIDTKVSASDINCGNGLLLCISSKNDYIGSGVVSSTSFKNYFFMLLKHDEELEELEFDICIYNHQLNMTMCKYEDKYSFNIKFDDISLNGEINSILLSEDASLANLISQYNDLY